jgi:hypothetical protein
MKSFKTIIFLLVPFIGLGQTANKLKAEQILDASIAFCGGEKRIADLESSDITYLLIQPDESTAIIAEKRKTGQKYVQSILSTEHVPQTTFFNNSRFTRVDGSSVIQVEDPEAMEEMKLKTYNQIQYGYKALGYELTRLPDQKFQYFDCYVVNAKAGNGYTTMNFFDKTNFRLLMVVYPNGNKSLMVKYLFKDNILFNSQIINTFPNSEEKQIIELQHIDLNIAISDLWFRCPYKDEVYTPSHIRTGKFESTNGAKTIFTRTSHSQDYYDDQGKMILRRSLKWAGNDTYGLVDEKAIKDNDTSSPGFGILVKIISWDDDGYVCHWIAGKYSGTQDYKVKK